MFERDMGGAGDRSSSPAAAQRGSSPEYAASGPPGVKSSGLWRRMEYVACVIHLGLMRGAGRLGVACAALVAVLRGGARRSEASRPRCEATGYGV